MFAQDSVARCAHVRQATSLLTVRLDIEAPEVTDYAKYATFREGCGRARLG